jgi:hypothetical protein
MPWRHKRLKQKARKLGTMESHQLKAAFTSIIIEGERMGKLKFLFLLAFVIFSEQALAEIIVIDDGTHGQIYASGKRLPDNHVFNIQGCVVEFIVSSGKDLIKIPGGFKGTLSDYRRGRNSFHGIASRDGRCFFLDGKPEREQNFRNYFHKFCEIKRECTEACRHIYKLVEDKTKLKLACP